MKKRVQDQLAKLKKSAERRRQRQLAKQAGLAENPVLGLIRGKRSEGAMVNYYIIIIIIMIVYKIITLIYLLLLMSSLFFFLASLW